MIPNLSNMYSILKSDVNALYVYRDTAKINPPAINLEGLDDKQAILKLYESGMSQEEYFEKRDAYDQYKNIENRTYAAANRIFGATLITVGILLVAKIILPIITFKFCLAMAVSITTFLAGNDIFEMSKAKEAMHGKNAVNLPHVKSSAEYILSKQPENVVNKMTEKTYLRSFWQAVLIKV